jgi:thiol-disulfide isomerase/thioredoxin
MMKRIVLTSLLLLFPIIVMAQSSPPAQLALKDINGRRFKLSDYKGKVLLVNFWATWCVPCRTEIPDLIKMQRQYRGKGLRVIGITYPPETINDVRKFTRSLRINYRIVMGTKKTKLLFTSSRTLPMTIVIGRDGSTREIIEGVIYQDEFDQKVKPLLPLTNF